MSTDRLAEIRADIVVRLEHAQQAVAQAELAQHKATAQAAEVMAELNAHDRAVAAMGEAQTQPAAHKRQRHDVRGVVRRQLSDLWQSERTIAATALDTDGISADAVHTYLLRAVRAGDVDRNGDEYRLKPPTGEFGLAEPRAKEAAE